MLRRKTDQCVAAALLAGAVLAGSGCSSQYARRDRPGLGTAQGSAWERVYHTRGTRLRLDDLDLATGPEQGRNDGYLFERRAEPLTAADQWPTPLRPSLERPRRIYLPDDPDHLLFFRETRRPRGTPGYSSSR